MKETLEHNRSLKTLEKVDKAINWSRIESILLSHYTVGTSGEGADVYPIEFEDHSIRVYPPLLLYRCLLLQKWFKIPSDPELESQINDRLSFKRFPRFSFDQPL